MKYLLSTTLIFLCFIAPAQIRPFAKDAEKQVNIHIPAYFLGSLIVTYEQAINEKQSISISPKLHGINNSSNGVGKRGIGLESEYFRRVRIPFFKRKEKHDRSVFKGMFYRGNLGFNSAIIETDNRPYEDQMKYNYIHFGLGVAPRFQIARKINIGSYLSYQVLFGQSEHKFDCEDCKLNFILVDGNLDGFIVDEEAIAYGITLGYSF